MRTLLFATSLFTLTLAMTLAVPRDAMAWTPFETTDGDVDEANELLYTGQYQAALEKYEAVRDAAGECGPRLHYGIGLALHHLGEYERSVTEFKAALEMADDELKVSVLYGLGTAYARWALASESSEEEGEKDKGLSRWQDARHSLLRVLRLDPEHEGALRNLELALMRVDPPCAVRDDEFERNDQSSEAALLELPEDQQELTVALRVCPMDDDWFRLPVQRGDRIFAKATSKTTGRRLSLELRSEDGNGLLRPPEGSGKTLTEFSFQEGTLQGEPRLHVVELDDEEAEYELEIRITPSCERLEDDFEDNDEPGRAQAISAEDAERLQALRLCPQDDDWYAVDVDPYWSLVVIGQFQVDKGQPSIAIVNEAGEVVAERTLQAKPTSASDGEQGGEPLMVTALEPPAGRYRIRVSGSLDVEAGYGLQVQVIPPCPEGEDGDEDNDVPAMATPVEPGQPKFLRVCPGDEDWFELKAQPGDKRQQVSISFDHERGDLDLELYGVEGTDPIETSAQSTSEMSAEGFLLPEVEEETLYRLRAYAAPEVQNFYLLNIQSPDGQPQGDQDKKDEEQDKKDEEQQKQDEQQKKPEPPKPRDPMEDEMDQLDHNPRNLEAERARKRPLLQRTRPTKPW